MNNISNFNNQDLGHRVSKLKMLKKGSNLVITNHTVFRFYNNQELDEDECYENYQNNEILNNNKVNIKYDITYIQGNFHKMYRELKIIG